MSNTEKENNSITKNDLLNYEYGHLNPRETRKLEILIEKDRKAFKNLLQIKKDRFRKKMQNKREHLQFLAGEIRQSKKVFAQITSVVDQVALTKKLEEESRILKGLEQIGENTSQMPLRTPQERLYAGLYVKARTTGLKKDIAVLVFEKQFPFVLHQVFWKFHGESTDKCTNLIVEKYKYFIEDANLTKIKTDPFDYMRGEIMDEVSKRVDYMADFVSDEITLEGFRNNTPNEFFTPKVEKFMREEYAKLEYKSVADSFAKVKGDKYMLPFLIRQVIEESITDETGPASLDYKDIEARKVAYKLGFSTKLVKTLRNIAEIELNMKGDRDLIIAAIKEHTNDLGVHPEYQVNGIDFETLLKFAYNELPEGVKNYIYRLLKTSDTKEVNGVLEALQGIYKLKKQAQFEDAESHLLYINELTKHIYRDIFKPEIADKDKYSSYPRLTSKKELKEDYVESL